ncbi:MAG: FAD-dependent thymidylate synthase [Anaerolineales bacterium]|nr:FAD-dependent thymidylate synthase [Anaerolineales bacterium]
MPKRDIYLLSSKELSPETIAVAFAKTSRFPDSFRDIAAELTDEKSAQFHEKWVVGYGHASVAEHAVLHLAIENASRIAMEAIESNRLASYTEKSTRYQKWDPEAFHVPVELDGHTRSGHFPLRDEYFTTCRMLFETYAASLEPVKVVIAAQAPRREDEKEAAYDRRIRSRYVDVCRFILPAASLANVGMTANGRVLENAIRKWLSSPLAEVREIGETVKRVAQGELPTLVKYAEAVEYLVETPHHFSPHLRSKWGEPEGGDRCTLVDYDKDGENKVLAAALYRFGKMPFNAALEKVNSASQDEREQMAEALLGKLGRYDVPLRELEHCTYTFDLIMDQGAYAEFKRHRMMTQTPQLQTGALGYATPRLITEAGFGSQYEAAMDAARSVWEKLNEFNPYVAQYVVPNGFNRRVLATFNLREAYAFCQLRAASNAHFSIRLVAQRVYEEISRVHPLLSKYMDLPDEPWGKIEEEYFTKA